MSCVQAYSFWLVYLQCTGHMSASSLCTDQGNQPCEQCCLLGFACCMPCQTILPSAYARLHWPALCFCRSWLAYQRTVAPVSLDTTSSEPITQSLLASLLLVLRRVGLTSPSSPLAYPPHQSQQARCAAAHNLLPELCQMAASLGCHAGLAASLIPLMMRSCHLSPSGSMPVISRHLHLVQAMYHAFHVRSVALREHHSQARQPPGASEATPGAMADKFVSANADLEGTLEGSLLAMALHLAQDAPGAQMLLDEGVADFLPALAKWLLSPDGAGQSFPCLQGSGSAFWGSCLLSLQCHWLTV